MAYSITLGGQDITNYVQQETVYIDDTLGQGAGAGSSATPQGRASTFKFNSSLGPMNKAVGSAQNLPAGRPTLVRQGEVIITDASGNRVFGGFATKYTDISYPTVAFTTVEGVDYSTSLARIIVNESYSAQTDVQMLTQAFKKYAPWVKLDYLNTTTSAYLFPIKNYKHVSLESMMQDIAGITGYNVWVDFNKYLHYTSPAATSTAPFNLSDQPDFATLFPHHVEEFIVDDNSIINRVYFYGGKRPVNDFSQDVSPLVNGTNKTFVFAFYPRPTLATGKIRFVVNGVDLVVGDMNGTGPKNTFKSKGGLCDVLVNGDAKAAICDVAPASGATVTLVYRYELPLVIALVDQKSYAYFQNTYFDGVISDQTIFDPQTAVQRSRVVLVQQSFGLVTLKVMCWRPGIQAGQLLKVVNNTRGINGTYLVQEVITEPIGSGNFRYTITLGAWNWNVVDVIMKLAALAVPLNMDTSDTTTSVDIEQAFSNAGVHDVWSKSLHTMGGYYARATAVGDGHDAYPGLCSITS